MCLYHMNAIIIFSYVLEQQLLHVHPMKKFSVSLVQAVVWERLTTNRYYYTENTPTEFLLWVRVVSFRR